MVHEGHRNVIPNQDVQRYLKGRRTAAKTLHSTLLGRGAVPLRLISQTTKVSSSTVRACHSTSFLSTKMNI